jgi:tetratricopeptide (TPR) repeat protein
MLTRAFPLLALAVSMMIGGCATQQQRAAQGDYNALFAQHRYSEAYDAAARTGGSMHSTHRDQASLVAGLSARALDRTPDAKRWLTPIAGNADPNIAGQASAALGAIAQEEGRHADAARLFIDAGSKLKGDDAAHAFMFAGDSLRALKKTTEAKAAYEKANALVSDASLKLAIGDRLSGNGPAILKASTQPSTTKPNTSPNGMFTVQAGAFSSLTKAKSTAAKLAPRGSTRTTPIKDTKGRTLYAVQVGRFATKQDAETLRRSLGSTAFVTTYD